MTELMERRSSGGFLPADVEGEDSIENQDSNYEFGLFVEEDVGVETEVPLNDAEMSSRTTLVGSVETETAVHDHDHDSVDDDDGFALFRKDDETETETEVPLNDEPAVGSEEQQEASSLPLLNVFLEQAAEATVSSPHGVKSALKRNSSYGEFEKIGEDIPICSKRSSWKTLPAPPAGKMRRSESSASFFHCQDSSSISSAKRDVSFANIQIRNYDVTAGDNPSCSYGTPVTLDWKYKEQDPLSIDNYEDSRGKRRSTRQMHLNSYQRKHILNINDVDETEIKAAEKAVQKIQRQRLFTSYLVPIMKIEDMVESAARKAKRLVNKNASSDRKPRVRSRSVGFLDEDDTVHSRITNHSVQTL